MNLNGLYGSYYNFLLNGVSSKYLKSSNKPDGKVDLKSVYGSYKKSAVNYDAMGTLSDVKANANKLKTALSKLTTQSSYTKQTAMSSDAEKLAVSGTYSLRTSNDMQVEIHKLATGQKNKGTALESDQVVGEGTYRFEVKTAGKTHSFEVKANDGDTVLDFQRKMALAINERNIGLTASVKREGENSSLNILADTTGDTDAARFTIRDTYGNAVEATGADAVHEEAGNAQYSVNGQERTSKNNSVQLGNGISGTLKDVTNGSVKVGMETDATHFMSAIRDMVKSYNDLMDTADKNDSKKLSGELSLISRNYANTLSRIGISLDTKGHMTLNETKLEKAAGDGSARSILTDFTNANYGFSARLSKTANKIASSPASYMGSMIKDSLMNTGYTGIGLFFNMQI
ncbi:flagellar filament capping protein FliD [Christensenellaceae bacterium OttesenSCG-928-M15]|nr:flagellar filament capping protein FliD [Christensenellaceae bacterium OttesenSCG-928-M15]